MDNISVILNYFIHTHTHQALCSIFCLYCLIRSYNTLPHTMWVTAGLTILYKHKFYITWGRIRITISHTKLQNGKGKSDAQDHTAMSSQVSQFPILADSTLAVLSQPSVSYPSPSGPCGCWVLLHGQCAKTRALQFKSPTPRGFSCCFSETDAFLCHKPWLWKQNRACLGCGEKPQRTRILSHLCK